MKRSSSPPPQERPDKLARQELLPLAFQPPVTFTPIIQAPTPVHADSARIKSLPKWATPTPATSPVRPQ